MVRPEVQEKQRVLYNRYGGMMTVQDVARELGTGRGAAKEWLEGRVKGCPIGKRVKYETDQVARAIVAVRGFV